MGATVKAAFELPNPVVCSSARLGLGLFAWLLAESPVRHGHLSTLRVTGSIHVLFWRHRPHGLADAEA
jgi:hypothetical protein